MTNPAQLPALILTGRLRTRAFALVLVCGLTVIAVPMYQTDSRRERVVMPKPGSAPLS